jgi:3-deoxy-manno-octulosonate cytidylyltransferase (CMP-KDO synthetase)
MTTVAIIPSRYGSTRLEGKPLRKIMGQPMIQRVYERTADADIFDDIFVATDDRRIFDTVEGFGGKSVLTSEENRSGTDRVAEAAEQIGLSPDDIVVNVQGDQPLMDSRCIGQLLQPFKRSANLDMTTLAFKIVDPGEISNPKDVKVVFDSQGYALYFSRAPIPFSRDPSTAVDFYKHLGLYAYPMRFLMTFRELPTGILEQIEKLEQLRVLESGYRIRVVITPFDSPEVDLPEDIERVEQLLRKRAGS